MSNDERYAPRPLAAWFKPAAIASVLFMMAGCAMYLMDVTTDAAALPLDQRALHEAMPVWMWAAYAVAVWIGLAGAIMLLLRKRIAVPLLAVSLLAVVVQFSAYLVAPSFRELISSDMLLVPIVIIAVTWTIFWFSYHSRKRGWLD